ncbi:MAG: aminodeoxychorismate lyase [Gammaproteobacteria bacterium]
MIAAHASSPEPDLVLIDGRPGESVSVADRGLHYGDGVFETLPIVAGVVCHWDRHLERLRLGCARLGLACPEDTLLRADLEVLRAGVDHGVVKLIVTRGVGGRGFRPPDPTEPTRIFARYPWRSYPAALYRSGIVARVCTTRLSRNPVLAGIKHLNRLEQVLARREWVDPEVHEGLMLDTGGRVIEGTMTNLFLVRAGRLVTPDLSECGVLGIMRGLVIEAAGRARLETEIRAVDLAEMYTAEGSFVCNSLVGVWPIRELQGDGTRRYTSCDLVARVTAAMGRDAITGV